MQYKIYSHDIAQILLYIFKNIGFINMHFLYDRLLLSLGPEECHVASMIPNCSGLCLLLLECFC